MKKTIRPNGYILPFTLLLLVLLLGLGTYFVSNLTSEIRISRSSNAGTTCFYLSEAGVEAAIHKLRNDPEVRTRFLTTSDGVTNFSQNSNLQDNASYEVTIQNSAPGIATIYSTGYYQINTAKKAKRKIKVNVVRANQPPPYNHDASIFTAGGTGNEDVDIQGATLRLHNSSMLANRDIWVRFQANVQVDKDVKAVNEIRVWPHSTLTYSGVLQQGVLPNQMPQIDFDSLDPNSYKNLAASQNQVYTQSQFEDLLKHNSPLNLSGIVYVTGQANLTDNQTLNLNGVLVADGSINIGTPTRTGTLNLTNTLGSPSGLISKRDINFDSLGRATIDGLIYAGDRVNIGADTTANLLTFKGAILARRLYIRGLRTIDITLDKDIVNQTLKPSTDSPVIELQHWEEEY